MIYHIATSAEWQSGQEEAMYTPAAFDADGFIHLSSLDQIVGVANRYFRGQRGLVLICVDPAAVEAPIKYEDLANQGQCYPHIYGKLNLDAVIRVIPFDPDPDGSYRKPVGLE
jgi:uncharacterized protein (DUF952 family)